MSDFQVLPPGSYISLDTHDRICRELHAEIRKLIVENGALRAKKLSVEQIESAWSKSGIDGRAPLKFAREIERLLKGME